MPVFSVEYLDGGAGNVGALVSAIGVGGLIGTIGIASFARYQTKTWVLIGGAATSGLGIMAFAAVAAGTGSFWLTMLAASLIGFTFAFFTIANGTSINLLVPDQFRGRVLSLRSITYSLAPLGGLALAGVAVFTGAAAAVALGGGVLTIAALGTYVVSRDIRRLQELVSQGAVAEAETARV
jgi:predicted MFS family arabinose efflux permease